jgi:hypothetical protein
MLDVPVEALNDLAEPPSAKCAERHRGYPPRVDLRGYLDAHGVRSGTSSVADKTSSTGLVASCR